MDEDLQAAVSIQSSQDSEPALITIVAPFQSQTQAVAQDTLEPDFRMRDRELNDIAKSISDLAELFKDLSSMVIDQGTLLDSVEYNIEQTVVEVQRAVKELDVATRCVSRKIHVTNAHYLSALGTKRIREGAAVYFCSS